MKIAREALRRTLSQINAQGCHGMGKVVDLAQR